MGGYGSDSEDRVELTCCAIARGERLLGQALEGNEVAVVGILDLRGAGRGAVSVGWPLDATTSSNCTPPDLDHAGHAGRLPGVPEA